MVLWLFLLVPSLVLIWSLNGAWFITFVTTATGMQMHKRYWGLVLILVSSASALLLLLGRGLVLEDVIGSIVVGLSVGLMMFAFARQIEALGILRRTQRALADVAVKEERNRVARDIHDILGHSLTVISVKAELAKRLVERDPVRAGVEIGEVQDLARGALADVRATVSGYREVNVLTELANARSALEAAGIDAELPGAADAVPARLRELFGWALREGVTNVVRHSGASHAKVALTPRSILIEDDGKGPAAEHVGMGNGLLGLRERAEAEKAVISVGRSVSGGYRLGVRAE